MRCLGTPLLVVRSASRVEMELVPAANLGNSNTAGRQGARTQRAE